MSPARQARSTVTVPSDQRPRIHEGATCTAATRFGPRHSLLLVELGGSGAEVAMVNVGQPLPSSSRSTAWRIIDSGGHGGQAAARMVVALVETAGDPGAPERGIGIELRGHGSGPASVLTVQAPDHVDLRTFLRRHLAGLDAVSRQQVLELLTSYFAARRDGVGEVTLAGLMMAARDALREPFPPCPRGPGEARGLAVDAIYALDEGAFWMRGWLGDRDAPLRRLTAVSPEGYPVELLDSIHGYVRPDLEDLYRLRPAPPEPVRGFMAYVRLPGASYQPDGWIVEMENELGEACEVLAPPVIQDPAAVRDALLRDFGRETPGHGAGDFVRPALTRVQESLHREAHIDEVIQFGDAPADPSVTVIVPLYRRVDFLEQQLAQFRHDPEVGREDLVYVLDSPEQKDALARQAAHLHALHGIAFRLAVMRSNVGYSGANNAGTSLARAPLLLFLNSDVLPRRPGWLGSMSGFHGHTRDVGAVGAKLLYEDDSLQHAGLYFDRSAVDGLWSNAHFFKGLHRDFGPANVTRPVPAVTGACMMIARDLFEEAGGFSGAYVQGDYEDSDLCVRLIQMGRNNWYLADAELYHLEAQSYPGEARRLASRYNRWLHSRVWGEQIQELMRSFEAESASGGGLP